jgi:hypothetical protein
VVPLAELDELAAPLLNQSRDHDASLPPARCLSQT